MGKRNCCQLSTVFWGSHLEEEREFESVTGYLASHVATLGSVTLTDVQEVLFLGLFIHKHSPQIVALQSNC
jgi:hypothetical protein